MITSIIAGIINLTILECKSAVNTCSCDRSKYNKSNHIGM